MPQCAQCPKDFVITRKSRKFCSEICKSRFHNAARKALLDEVVGLKAQLEKALNATHPVRKPRRPRKSPKEGV